jgi:hypothetical protein
MWIRIQFIKIRKTANNVVFLSRFGPFFVEPIVAGLEPDTFEPYICNMDLIGCITEPTDFVAGGTCEEQLMGMCETLWEPNMGPGQLFECISQVRFPLSGRSFIQSRGISYQTYVFSPTWAYGTYCRVHCSGSTCFWASRIRIY